MRLRRSDESRRYAAPQRSAKIDPNPHQIDAVMFALSRLREGGCILADEVGLGKTIEAGLVIAQLLSEGAKRVLLVAPKPLLGQWRQELYALFRIDIREGRAEAGGFDGDGVFVAGREMIGSERARDVLLGGRPFDLCVVDEAHEMFAGIYKRFDEYGVYQRRIAPRTYGGAVAGGARGNDAGPAPNGHTHSEQSYRTLGARSVRWIRRTLCSATCRPSALCSALTTTARLSPVKRTNCASAWR